jgi:ABC-type multidrug transport system fused ATPase/permease subunit
VPKPFSKSVIARSIYILPKNDFSKIIGVVLIQILMGLLDLAGVMAIGLLGVLAVSSEGTDRPLENVHVFLKSINVMELDNQGQIIFLASAAVILFVLRTFFSIYFTRRILFFFSARSAQISSNLISRVLSKPALIMQENTLQETLYAVTRGVEFITIYVLATLLVLLADFSMLAIMSVGLFVVDPLTAILTLTNFAAIGFALYKFMHLRAQRLGLKSAKLNVKSNAKITEILESYRESVVRNRRSFYSREIGELRLSLANTLAETNFLPYVSKYIVETAVVMSALMLGGLQFLFHDAKTATATLAVFLAAGTRIAPAVLRIQQGSIQVQIGIGASNSTLELIEKFENSFAQTVSC